MLNFVMLYVKCVYLLQISIFSISFLVFLKVMLTKKDEKGDVRMKK